MKNLHQSMREQKIKRTKFDFKFNKAEFKCLFFIDENPYWLVLAIKGTNFFIKLNVEVGYVINPILEPKDYFKLKELLGLKSSKEKFSIKGFFETFNGKIPNTVRSSSVILPYETAPFFEYPEKTDGMYFVGWINHDGIKSNAQSPNLEKTKTLIGKEAYLICKKKNISSRWSDKEKYKFNVPQFPN
ncbi:DUF6037 family protein [Peribacillus frigoritolerans]|uniref:DUF6037 family protein n=1 Tax=Peribacillus frigoritolerans TaxID=450367 RepID=UPI0021CEDF65|nr:DUF6037 family protein [Peribacillus frigoritolerans]MCU6599283.1 DUF6037 family protein [Peribacillus frigoritolerans]MDF2000494.1 DUF6037 family protein [Peribacillus frigoritolerans]